MDTKQFWDDFNQGNLYQFSELCPTCGHPLLAFKGRDDEPLAKGACPYCGYRTDNGHLNKAKQTDEFYQQARKKDAINYFSNVSVFATFSVFNHRFDKFVARTDKQRQVLGQANKISNQLVGNELTHSIFTGGTGTGKTHLAVSVLWDVLERTSYKRRVAFVDFQELLTQKKNAIGSRDDARKLDSKITKIKQSDIIVIDDLGAESNGETSQYNLDLASSLIKAREAKSLIITTNLKGKDLREVYGERVLSRILAYSSGNSLIFDNLKDWRLNGIAK